ncbi:WD40 repeat-like protein [Aulographum hederae CBS 113979]|uniref:WD40 repeat-like protein n=1 Tax=Aulographum hederae CBS 113979 TaxID=1176131 RepID=A0A6G1H1V9_9PEZI|nr:WD40 repeat-like protein [Aulographum hederae CBS 113979]
MSTETAPMGKKRKRTKRDSGPAALSSKRSKSQDDVKENNLEGNGVSEEHVSGNEQSKDAEKEFAHPYRGKKEKKTPKADVVAEENPDNLQVQSTTQDAEHAAKKGKRRQKQRSEESRDVPLAVTDGHADPPPNEETTNDLWAVSDAIGGRFLRSDPVFSADEKFLILATARTVQIFSTATSILLRNIPVEPTDSLSDFCLSVTKPDHLYISTISGRIILWNWTKGEKIAQWSLDTEVKQLAAIVLSDSSEETLFTLEKEKRDWKVNAHSLQKNSPLPSQSVTLLNIDRKIRMFKVCQQGAAVIAATDDQIHVCSVQYVTDLVDATSSCSQLRSNESITTFEILERDGGSGISKKHAPKRVDLVVGSAEGTLFVYEDVLSKLGTRSQKSTSSSSVALNPLILHWHRQAVGTVRWSRDGNYIISGGKETTLILWQLSTGKKQALPHLAAAIDNLVVSPSGTSYAVHLADNSVIVLSTSELAPKASFTGIQSQAIHLPDWYGYKFHTVDSHESKSPFQKHPATIHPKHPSHILLTVPASQPWTESFTMVRAQPYLQTYDISAMRHVSRQALARNLATQFNEGPEGNKLKEPDVRFVQVSADGSWLATVEEWTPLPRDLEFLAAISPEARFRERASRREVYLKFWKWDAEKSQWGLGTRIDTPHIMERGSISGRVFDLVADPSGVGFATVGEDGFVRVWQPKSRMRNGRIVTGSQNEGLVNWTMTWALELERNAEALDADADVSVSVIPSNGKIAWSEDGSVIVATQDLPGNKNSAVHFIDAFTGDLKITRQSWYKSGLSDLGFLGRYLVILSDELYVWDTLSDTLVYGFVIEHIHALPKPDQRAMAHLAIDTANDTFAISICDKRKSNKKIIASTVVVFKPDKPNPIYQYYVPKVVTALLPAVGSAGYVLLDADAQILILKPQGESYLPTAKPLAAIEEDLLALEAQEADEDEDVEDPLALVEDGVDQAMDAMMAGGKDKEGDVDMADAVDDERTVVRPQQLGEIFDTGTSWVMPPLGDLFGGLMGMMEV